MSLSAFLRLLALAGMVFLHGCTLVPQGRDTPAPVETRDGRVPGTEVETRPAPRPSVPDEVPPEPAAARAYGPLLARAEAATGQGDYDQALSLLERAQRIDPDNARIYLELARTYAAQGRPERARNMAERGLLYCRGERECDALRAFLR
ncbi:tetratricopeptide repeat protein [Haliea atlantica]|nr:hypothetical protein [Haliea sp.]MAL95313.1 hypothetical protein [Haliea sp.]|tara:strand:+ start:303783 stop:304229 length:447 start_codon:yes stop_codon:yes gene_type:complete